MNWIRCHIPRLLKIVLIAVGFMLFSHEGYSMDVKSTFSVGAIASDNIFRDIHGDEVIGQLIDLKAGISIETIRGANKLSFLGEGGTELLFTESTTNQDIYDFRLTGTIGLGRGMFGEASRVVSRETMAGGESSYDRARVTGDHSYSSLKIGSSGRARSNWDMTYTSDQFKRDVFSVDEERKDFRLYWLVGNRTSLSFLINDFDGEEINSNDSWSEGSALVDWNRSSNQRNDYGFLINWLSSKQREGLTGLNDKYMVVGIEVYRNQAVSQQTDIQYRVGAQAKKINNNDVDLNPKLEFGFSKNLDRKVRLVASTDYQAERLRGPDQSTTLNQRTDAAVGLEWEIGQNLSLLTDYRWVHDEFLTEQPAEDDRRDNSRTTSVSFDWRPGRSIHWVLTAVSETIDSTLSTENLAENRLELNIDTTIF